MGREALDRFSLEQPRIEDQGHLEPFFALRNETLQIRPGRPDLLSDRSNLQALEFGRLPRHILEGKDDLKERIATEVPFRLQLGDELFEGQILVFVGAERHFVHPRQRLAKGRIT